MVKRWRQHHAGVKMMLLMAAAAICLSGCGDLKSSGVDPIEWYRDLNGNSKNDLKDKAAANSKNLEQGGKVPYPNLASVPKEPDNAITKIDRDKMAQSLIADRTHAQYTDEQLRAGQNMQAVVVPPPDVTVTPSSNTAAASATAPPAAAAPTAAPKPPSAATARAVAVASPAAPSATPRVAAAPAQPVKQEPLPPAAPTPKGQQMAAIPSAAGPSAERIADTAPPPDRAPKKGDAKKKEVRRGSEPAPEKSSLRSPTISAMPKGEEAQEPPPSPVDTASGPKRTARASHAEEVAAATPSHGDVDAGKSQRSGGQTVEIKFTPGASRGHIPEGERNRLIQVAKLLERNNNARVRIVGYAGAPAQGDRAQREFQSFNAALDNAKAVGIELAKLGVPPSRIDIETKANAGSADRAEIFVQY